VASVANSKTEIAESSNRKKNWSTVVLQSPLALSHLIVGLFSQQLIVKEIQATLACMALFLVWIGSGKEKKGGTIGFLLVIGRL
jgi:hypothetical protein